jgi:hypothetical protein
MDAIKNIIEHSNQYTESFNRISLVAGGAGFVGSHLCNRLLDSGYAEVVCVDNLQTGSLRNIEGHLNNPRFRFVEHDIIEPFFFDDYPRKYHLLKLEERCLDNFLRLYTVKRTTDGRSIAGKILPRGSRP